MEVRFWGKLIGGTLGVLGHFAAFSVAGDEGASLRFPTKVAHLVLAVGRLFWHVGAGESPNRLIHLLLHAFDLNGSAPRARLPLLHFESLDAGRAGSGADVSDGALGLRHVGDDFGVCPQRLGHRCFAGKHQAAVIGL